MTKYRYLNKYIVQFLTYIWVFSIVLLILRIYNYKDNIMYTISTTDFVIDKYICLENNKNNYILLTNKGYEVNVSEVEFEGIEIHQKIYFKVYMLGDKIKEIEYYDY